MITAKKISAELKLEVLTAIRKANFNCSDFEQNFEGSSFSSANCKKEIETENFNIVIELTENVIWSSFRDYEFENIEIADFKVKDENSDYYQNEFPYEEIINAVNY